MYVIYLLILNVAFLFVEEAQAVVEVVLSLSLFPKLLLCRYTRRRCDGV